MTALPTFNGGTEPTASQWQTLLPLFARKTADQSLSTLTFTNDNALFVSVASNVIYFYHLFTYIKANNASNGGMKVQFAAPAGADLSDAVFRWGGNTSPGAQTNAGGAVGALTLTTSNVFFEEQGLLVMGANSGTFQFQWAQNSGPTNSATVSAGSFLLLRQVT